MSRSRRHTPITGITCSSSNKKFKVCEHGRERARVTANLRPHLAEDRYDLLTYEDPYIGNEWASPRDGKQWIGELKTQYPNQFWIYGCRYKFNAPEEYQRLMRK